ncbi:HU family DNA-binding protein [Leptolyngbya ohadii]|uniref:HU family DNA-binding protein n=1 Tax=Leptolyngbya ohadii TaxID=1962290 RepID=UPI0021F23EF4|nr:HU family DNA-binding protein [Leptolyngbya ohadii]
MRLGILTRLCKKWIEAFRFYTTFHRPNLTFSYSLRKNEGSSHDHLHYNSIDELPEIPMNKGELVDQIAEKANVTKKEADAILSAAVESIMEAVAEGDKVTLVGFGTFERRDRQAREGRNPQTGQTISIPASKVPAFSAGKGFKDAVAG